MFYLLPAETKAEPLPVNADEENLERNALQQILTGKPTMQLGLWINHRAANMVFLSHTGEKTRQIKANVEKQLPWSQDSSCDELFKTPITPAPRGEYVTRLPGYYEEVFLAAHGADTVLIFGPGKAKDELRKQFHKRHFGQRIVGFETAGKMTKRQVSKKVRDFYTVSPAILCINGKRTEEADRQ